MNIKELIKKSKLNIEINGITNNPYEVKTNYIFVLTNNSKNSHLQIKRAILNNASLIISNKNRFLSIPHYKTKNPYKEYIRLLKKFYHYNPIYTVGVIGNNGNSAILNLLNNIFNKISKAAKITKNEISYLNRCYKTKDSSSSIIPSYRIFNNHNIKNVSINLDFETIIKKQINMIELNGIIFTNFSYRHSNNKKMYDYFKKENYIMKNIKKDTLLVMNIDDLSANILPKYSINRIITYGINNGIYQAKNIKKTLTETNFDIYYKNKFLVHLKINTFSTSSIYNVLAVISYTNELGIPLNIIKSAIESFIYNKLSTSIISSKVVKELSFNSISPYELKETLIDLKNLDKFKIISIINSNIDYEQLEKQDIGYLSTAFSDITIFICSNNFNNLLDYISNVNFKDYYICPSEYEAYKLAYSLYSNNDIIIRI